MIVSDILLCNRTALSEDLSLESGIGDEELVRAAWREYGVLCADRLDGDFAFALRDPGTGAVYAARDHIGSRPLYYRIEDGQFRAASTLRELLTDSEERDRSRLDERYVLADLSPGLFVSNDRTPFRAIRKLPPGHWLHFSQGRVRVERYWHPDRLTPTLLPTPAAYISEGRRLLRRAVECRLPASGHVGVHLSGGLDSSAIAALLCACLAAKNAPAPLAYVWSRHGAEDEAGEDGGLIDAMARETGIDLQVVEQDSEQLAALLRKYGPADPDISTLLVEDAVQRAAAADGVKTIFSGWGGDEGLSYNGRGHAADLLLSGRWRMLAGLAGGGWRGLATGLHRSVWEYTSSLEDRRAHDPAASGLASDELRTSTKPLPSPRLRCTSRRDMQIGLVENGHLAARMEGWAEAGAKHGISYRFPLLDRKLLEFALGVPGDLFYREGQRRWLFREITRGLLPDAVRTFTSKYEARRADEFRAALDAAYRSLAPDVACATARRGENLVDLPRLLAALESESPTRAEKAQTLRVAMRYCDLP